MANPSKNHFNVVIIGAGLSGLGSACHLVKGCPDVSFLILEDKEALGGTWHTHNYPGVRCDSDFSLYGFAFKPWLGKPIATGAEIMGYLKETVEEYGLAPHIRYNHRISHVEWSSAENQWTIHGRDKKSGKEVTFTANFLLNCAGYYKHSEGHTPTWPGMENFKGRIVHPQTWPKDLNYKDKTVVVIGSGATAATLIPSMAADCKHITMLQRSPTYFRAKRNINELAHMLRELKIDDKWIHEIVRRKLAYDLRVLLGRTWSEPEKVKQELVDDVQKILGPDFDVKKHFTPKYRPWQQRVAFVPDGDLFKAIISGKASVETDEISSFTESGILLKSGKTLPADIIVTATGFQMSAMGDIKLTVDQRSMKFSDFVNYRGMMLVGLPNFAFLFGYFRGAWTPRVHLVGDFLCRLFKHMRVKGAHSVTVRMREKDKNMKLGPWMNPELFNSTYVMRALDQFPKSGDNLEWQLAQCQADDEPGMSEIDLNDEVFQYEGSKSNRRKKAA